MGKTERVDPVTLHPFSPDLAHDVLAGIRRERWADGFPTDGDREVAGRIADGTWTPTSAARPWGPWAVHAGAVLVGGAGFHGPPDADGCVEIGYGIAEELRGQGLATAAVSKVLVLAREHGARKVVAGTDPDNIASQRVLEHCGFVRDGDADDELRWALPLLAQSTA